MTNHGVRPEDILADNQQTLAINGVEVRKGTVAAVLANASILKSDTSTNEQKQSALSIIKELAPALVAVGLHEHVKWNNSEIQAIINEHAK